jgi:3-hexulose-6-phosphate synthase
VKPSNDASALQLALDQPSLNDASNLVTRLAPAIARVEIGTPLVISAGLAAIERVRKLSPRPMTVVADVKICDAGEKIARSAFAAGADVVTAVAAALDEVTWRGVLAAAADHAPGEPAPVVLDTIGPAIDFDALRGFAGMAAEAGVGVGLCVHRPKHASPAFADLIRPVTGTAGFEHVAVAGKLKPAEVRAALDAGFGTLIVGGAVADASQPEASWGEFLTEVRQWRETASADR